MALITKLTFFILIYFCEKNVMADDQMDKILKLMENDFSNTIQLNSGKHYVFVVGENGVGKTTFSKWITGSSELITEELENGTLIIRNKNEETDTKPTREMFPNLYQKQIIIFSDFSSNTYCDFPEFQNGPDYELGTAYFLNRTTERFRNTIVKVLFLVDFDTVKNEADRDKFKNALARFSSYIKNVEKLKKSIAMVVTKVPGYDPFSGSQIIDSIKMEMRSIKSELEQEQTPEKSHQIQIIDQLMEKIGIFPYPDTVGDLSSIDIMTVAKIELDRLFDTKMDFVEIEKSDFEYVTSDKSKIFVLEILDKIKTEFSKDVSIICDEINEHYIELLNAATKDTIFQLNTNISIGSEMLKKLKNNAPDEFLRELTHIVCMLNVDFKTDHLNKYFNHMKFLSELLNVTLSIPTKSIEHTEHTAGVILINAGTLTKQLETIDFPSFYINIDFGRIFREIKQFYLQIEKNTVDLDDLLQKLNRGVKVLKGLKTEAAHVFLKEFIDVLNELQIGISPTALEQIKVHINEMTILNNVKNQTTFIPLAITEEFNEILVNIENSIEWYQFLITLLDNIPNDAFSNEAAEKIATACDRGVKSVSELGLEQLMGTQNKDLDRIENIELNPFKLAALKRILNILIEDIDITCPEKEALLAKGMSFKLSKVIQHSCWLNATIIEIFALKSIIIDSDIDKTGQMAQLTIISPVWHIYGDRRIVLNGQDGLSEVYNATSGGKVSEQGKDGTAGASGRDGGTFFGIGQTFLNGHQLKIEANGGRGGNGQNGGEGAVGLDGEDPSIPDCSPYWWKRKCANDAWNGKYEYECKSSWYNFYRVEYEVKGIKGKSPGSGGNGGDAGTGGFAGNIQLIELNEKSNVFVSTINGKSIIVFFFHRFFSLMDKIYLLIIQIN